MQTTSPAQTHSSYDEQRVKHLEFIQAVIARLGNNGFVIKGWAVTVSGVFFGFAVSSRDWQLALASTLPTLAFWLLDGYLLRCERLFRELYEKARQGDASVAPFFMAATAPKFADTAPASTHFRSAVLSPTLRGLYGALLAAAAIVVLLISQTNQ